MESRIRSSVGTGIPFGRMGILGLMAVLCGPVACIQQPDDSSGSEEQYSPSTSNILPSSGHASDCAIETLQFNDSIDLYGFSLTLERSWGNGVSVFLERPEDPGSVVCAHPRRIIAGNGRSVQGITVVVDGFGGPEASQIPGQFDQMQRPLQMQSRFVNIQNRRFIATEVVPGACSDGGGQLQEGCVVWGVVRNDRRVSLVNGSCLGGYRIAGVSPGVDRNVLFQNNRVRDLRGSRFGGCFVLARREWSMQPPQWSSHWDGPIPPYYGGSGQGQSQGGSPGWNPYPIGSGYQPGYVPPWYVPGTNYGPGIPGFSTGEPLPYPGGAIPGQPPGVGGPPGGPLVGPPCPGGLPAGPGCGPIAPGPGQAPYPWNSGFAFFPGWVGYGEPPWGQIIGLQAIDTLLSFGQYKLCRDASPKNFAFQSALACRLAGYLGSGPAYGQCAQMCYQLFAGKQAAQAGVPPQPMEPSLEQPPE